LQVGADGQEGLQRGIPGIGEFQCYDKYMLADLEKAARAAGNDEWCVCCDGRPAPGLRWALLQATVRTAGKMHDNHLLAEEAAQLWCVGFLHGASISGIQGSLQLTRPPAD
jgi:hypothetical protein